MLANVAITCPRGSHEGGLGLVEGEEEQLLLLVVVLPVPATHKGRSISLFDPKGNDKRSDTFTLSVSDGFVATRVNMMAGNEDPSLLYNSKGEYEKRETFVIIAGEDGDDDDILSSPSFENGKAPL